MRALLTRRFPAEALRAAVAEPRLDRGLWRELGAAGFFALRLPESGGGVGLGLPEAALAFEEAGRALLPGPLVPTHLAAGRVPGAATGETVVTAVDGGLVEWLEEADVVVGADGVMGSYGVAGSYGATGSEVVSGAGGAPGSRDEPAVEQVPGVERQVPGVGRVPAAGGSGARGPLGAVPLRSVDPLTPLHRVPGTAGGAGAAAGSGAGPGAGEAGAGRAAGSGFGAGPVAVLLSAAEQVGSAGRVCELAVGYARHREQFGRPIGTFQAVQHLCAEMFARVETARVAVYAAAVTGDPLDIAAARLLADEAAVRGARDCVQVHGGMGFTWEAEIHLHLKRAWVRARRGGGRTESEEALAAGLVRAGGG